MYCLISMSFGVFQAPIALRSRAGRGISIIKVTRSSSGEEIGQLARRELDLDLGREYTSSSWLWFSMDDPTSLILSRQPGGNLEGTENHRGKKKGKRMT
jgi:hypothetical protein